ncbi:phosphopantetheine-binding protein, partial [Pseudomonas sichuanensis]|uniref:phosphopantetheine-binding protein n=1 Tax=Pseudomonas sichuanensis TaxID=2213015 RepID=UPI00381F927F
VDTHNLRDTLKASLLAQLPDYMVPSHWVLLAELPLSPNGKLERKALPRPDVSQVQVAYVAPQTQLERDIAAIWQEVLQVERVGLRDDFFSLGGHSLLATQVMVRLRERLNLDVPLKHLFTAADLAAFCEQAAQLKADGPSIEEELAKSLEALKRLSGGELEELIS